MARLLEQEALLRIDDSSLTLEHPDALSRAIPDDTERRDTHAFLEVRAMPHRLHELHFVGRQFNPCEHSALMLLGCMPASTVAPRAPAPVRTGWLFVKQHLSLRPQHDQLRCDQLYNPTLESSQ